MMLKRETWERFCQAIAAGEKAVDAYITAGFVVKSRTVAKVNAHRLMQNPKIKQRLGELQGWFDERISVTKELFEEKLAAQVDRQAQEVVADIRWIKFQLVDAHEVAKARNDTAGRCRALELLGKAEGMFVDKSENLNVQYQVSDAPMSAEDWTKKYTAEEKPDVPVSSGTETKH